MFETLETRNLFAATPAAAPASSPEPTQPIALDAPATPATTSKESVNGLNFTKIKYNYFNYAKVKQNDFNFTKVTMNDFHFVTKNNSSKPM